MFGFNLTDRIALYAASGLFLVSFVAAVWLAFGKHSVEGQLRAALDNAEAICTAAGSSYAPRDAKGGTVARKEWGRACLGAVRDLAREAATRATLALETVTTHQAAQVEKASTDRKAAQADTTRRARAKAKVEHINAQVSGDRRDGRYLAGLNELMGLRDELEVALPAEPAGGGDAEGHAAGGPVDVPFEAAGLSH